MDNPEQRSASADDEVRAATSKTSSETHTSMQDKLMNRLFQHLFPEAEMETKTSGSGKSGHSQKPNFSLPIMSNNFRRFNARIGVVFVFQVRMGRLFAWRNPAQTLCFLAVFTFCCLDPSRLIILPLIGLLYFLMVPAYIARHPPPPGSTPLDQYALRGPATAPPPKVRPAPDMSKDFFRNMRDLQNSMDDFSIAHDKLVGLIGPVTNFSNEKLSSTIFITLVFVSSALFITSGVVPWRFIILLGGWSGVLSSHPKLAPLLASTKTPGAAKKGPKMKSQLGAWFDDEILLDEAPEKREVEIFELQRSQGDGADWEPWIYSTQPYTPWSSLRISGDRPRGTRFFEDVECPKGWEWAAPKWALDLQSEEWVEARLITAVEVETEGERWVYDLEPPRKLSEEQQDYSYKPDKEHSLTTTRSRSEWRRRRIRYECSSNVACNGCLRSLMSIASSSMDWRGGGKSRHQIKAVDAVKRRQKSHFAEIKRRQRSNNTSLQDNFVPSWLCSKDESNVSSTKMQTQLDQYRPFKPVVDRLSSMARHARRRNPKQFSSPSFQPDELERPNAQYTAKGIISSPTERYPRNRVFHRAQYSETPNKAVEASATTQHTHLDNYQLEGPEQNLIQETNLTRYLFDKKELLQIPDWAGLALAKPARFNFDNNSDRAAIGKRRRVTKDDRARRDGLDTRKHVPAVQERRCKEDLFGSDEELCGRASIRDSIHQPLSFVAPECRETPAENASQLARQLRTSLPGRRSADPTEERTFSTEEVVASDKTIYAAFPTNPFDLSDLMPKVGKQVNLENEVARRHRCYQHVETSPPPIACVAADGVPKLAIYPKTPVESTVGSAISGSSDERSAESPASPTILSLPNHSTVRNVEEDVAINFTQDLGSDLEEYLLRDLEAHQNGTLHAYVESSLGCQTDCDMAPESLPRTSKGADAGLNETESNHRRERSHHVASPPAYDLASPSKDDTVTGQAAHRSISGTAPRATTGGNKFSQSLLRVCDGFL